MTNVTPLKPKNDYSHFVIVKQIDGKPVECTDIDAMSEDQFKKYCADTGTEWFQRFTIGV